MDTTGALTWWGGWVPAFVLTCAIEVPVYLVMLELFGLVGKNRGGQLRRLGRGRAVLLALVLNVITHPAFWAFALHADSTIDLLVGEVGVTLVEGLGVWAVVRRSPPACLTCVLVANAASAVLGIALVAYVISWAS